MKFTNKIYQSFLRRFDTRRYNDTILRNKNVIHDGALTLGSKAAIYLIFPKAGLLQSHVLALQYMIENGYSPIVVSNLPLNKDDLDQLRPLTYRILQRENFGYDFGGYREGILVFQDQIKTLDHLALFNDSVWFPVQNTRSWLQDAEAAQKDLMGAVSHIDFSNNDWHKILHQLTDQFDNAPFDHEWIDDPQSWLDEFSNRLKVFKLPPKPVLAVRQYLRKRRSRNNNILFHYCSFALLIGRNILREPDFYYFWQRLKIADDWLKTIIRGEIGFTQWTIGQNFTHGSVIDREIISARISEFKDEQLTAHLHKVAPVGVSRSLFEFYHQLIGSHKHPNMLSLLGKRIFLQSLLQTGNITYIAPFYLWSEHNFQFFKKKNFSFSSYGHKIAIEMIPNMPEPIKSEMLVNLQKTAQSYTTPQADVKISGKRKILGIWVGLPHIWH